MRLTSTLLQFVLATPIVVVDITVPLRQLGAGIGEVAGKEEVVLGRDGQGIPHEGECVDCQSAGHLTRDAVGDVSLG